MLLVALVGIGLLVVRPAWRVERVLVHEEAAWREVVALSERAEAARRGVVRDLDRDGVGEPPPLGVLVRGEGPRYAPGPGGQAWRCGGYWFALLTPGIDRRAAFPTDEARLADYAEIAYAIVAWPADPGTSGMRAYLWTPADAKVLRHAVDGFPYGGAERPPLPAEPLVGREGGELRARRVHEPGADSPWKPPRESAPD